MPLGWERINVRKTVPNKNIVFIKPRPGPDEATSRDFLERIAAQCLPIMNNNQLSVASLEEYEPNLEFWGRNFNGGEVIQLVLKSPSTGHWLPFKFVQMVMMHELAHNKQMNHSSAFHKVRIGFTNEMKVLWERGYTGDGLWGQGILLANGSFDRAELAEGEILPEHLCGGTFKSRRSVKRKAKPKITYKDKQERRIAKKFGTNGVALGADEEVKSKLEKGKKLPGKPRVAKSARGRELRAAAALARFETTREEPEYRDEDLVTDSEAESDSEGGLFIKTEPPAVDIDGSRLLDKDGLPLVKICVDENDDDEDAKNERLELENFGGTIRQRQLSREPPKYRQAVSKPLSLIQPKRTLTEAQPSLTSCGEPSQTVKAEDILTTGKKEHEIATVEKDSNNKTQMGEDQTAIKSGLTLVEGSCKVCSMTNDPTALTCMTCSNVLKPEFVPNSWRCRSSPCKGSHYMNAGDVGLCGACGARKCSEDV